MHRSLLLLIALAGCAPAVPDALLRAMRPARIAEDIQTPYDRDQYPELFEMLASEAHPDARIQRARVAFAEQVAAHPDCEHVEMSDVSIHGSSSGSLLMFAYCTNATDRLRFRAVEAIVDPADPISPDLTCPLSGGRCKPI